MPVCICDILMTTSTALPTPQPNSMEAMNDIDYGGQGRTRCVLVHAAPSSFPGARPKACCLDVIHAAGLHSWRLWMILVGPCLSEYVIFNPAQVLPMYRVTF